MRKINLFFYIFFIFIQASAEDKINLYIVKYKDLAINEMKIYFVPASITLAQAILESGSGESRLAVEGMNHFGIKCHNDWSGATILEDDDEKGECFRKYKKVSDSYRDHSLFLSERDRYAFLFDYKINDYKLWAKGLQEAGYATNSKYSDLIIDLIERYNLNEYDAQENKKIFFGHSYGFPDLIGVGVYYFPNRYMLYSKLSTTFLFSSACVGYDYKLFNNLYIGTNTGVLYLPAKDHDILPQISAELVYKKISRGKRCNAILIRGGVQVPLYEMDYKLFPNYLLIPYLDLIYLID